VIFFLLNTYGTSRTILQLRHAIRPLLSSNSALCRCRNRPCYWSFFDCASRLALSTLLVIVAGSASPFSPFQPSTCPIRPPGFGTGHSLFGASLSSNCFLLSRSSLMTSLQVSSSVDFRLRRLLFPVGSGESASVRGSTGHGNTWGAATTRNETMRVVVKSDVVMRDRG
jgi:hypothetical protein